MKHIISSSGFTLIEMAVVVLLAGILISIISSVAPKFILSGKIRDARGMAEKIDYSVEGYMAGFGRCPCPDTDADGVENRNDQGTAADFSDDTCAAYSGYLPYRTMGLPSGEDTWGTPFAYSVHQSLVRTAHASICATMSSLISSLTACDTAKLHTSLSGRQANQACAVISSGPNKTLDGLNSGSDMEFESPGRGMEADYDDIVRARSFAELYGRHCVGN